MKRSDVELRYTRGAWRDPLPALNVKVHSLGLDASAVASEFKCDQQTAERALQFAFDAQQRNFWEGCDEIATDIFGEHVKVYSDGRSGGWLTVEGLGDVTMWDVIAISRWARFAKAICADIAWRISADVLREDIDANQWAKPGAEEYNFVNTPKGPRCIADLKAEAIAAGFGPIIRSK